MEIQAAASLFQVPVYVATDSLVQGSFKWTAFKPHDKLRLKGTEDVKAVLPSLSPKQHLELCHTANSHYDSVISLNGNNLPPPSLDGEEYSIDICD